MSVSGDYDLSSVEEFNDKFGDLLQIVDADTTVKTVNVTINFQTREPGILWGESLKDRTVTIERQYPIATRIPSDAELLALLKPSLEKSNPMSKLGPNNIKEVTELLELLSTVLFAINPDKYPTLLAALCQDVREIDDASLFEFIRLHQLIITSPLSDENPEKIRAKALSNLSLESSEAQALLSSIRQKLNESSPIDLFLQARAYLRKETPAIIRFLENQVEQEKERNETLRLPVESDKVQRLIAPLRDKMLENNRQHEIYKVARCYLEAILGMKATSGEKQLSGMDVKVVYVKRSNPNQDFVYEKKYSPDLKS